MLILKYIVLIITAGLGIIAVMNDYKRKGSEKTNKAGILIIVLILLSLAGSICFELLSDRDLKNKESELNKFILGEDYAIFEVMGKEKHGEYYSFLKNFKKYPIYDITLLVTDFDEAIKCKTSIKENEIILDADCYFRNSTNVSAKTLPQELMQWVDYEFKSTLEYKNLEIIFSSRNSNIWQQAVYKLQEGFCHNSYRIYKKIDGKVTLIETNNDIGLQDSYWDKHFLPIQGRELNIFKD
jgi:hypothetical protein